MTALEAIRHIYKDKTERYIRPRHALRIEIADLYTGENLRNDLIALCKERKITHALTMHGYSFMEVGAEK